MSKILLAILCLMLLILLHEFGHFIAAKIFHVKVTDFSVGMGPPIVSKTMGETTYRLSCLPIGGYCAMVGEDGNTEDPRSLQNLVWYKRIVIMLAGITMNFAIGLVLLSILIFPHSQMVVPIVEAVSPEVSQTYNIQPGDRILSIDSFKIFIPNDVLYADVLDRDRQLTFKLLSAEGEPKTITSEHTVSLNGTVSFSTEPGTPQAKIKQIFNGAASMIQAVIQSLKLLFTGKVDINDMSGPIGIIDTAAKAQSSSNFVYIFAFISINLACMNLLPIPALDGGQALLCLAEGVFKKKVPAKAIAVVNMITMLLLMGLILIVSVLDITKLFS